MNIKLKQKSVWAGVTILVGLSLCGMAAAHGGHHHGGGRHQRRYIRHQVRRDVRRQMRRDYGLCRHCAYGPFFPWPGPVFVR